MSVVADAVSTAYQAVCRGGVERGDMVVVVGTGGVGGYVVQIASALGAKVLGCDLRADRMKALRDFGLQRGIELEGADPREVREQVREQAHAWGIESVRLRIFECSGTPGGQSLAYSLIERASRMVQVGFSPEKVKLRLSRLMALDAEVAGTWGCPPERYAGVLELIAKGAVRLAPFVEQAPMSRLNELLTAMAEHRLERRMVLDPRT